MHIRIVLEAFSFIVQFLPFQSRGTFLTRKVPLVRSKCQTVGKPPLKTTPNHEYRTRSGSDGMLPFNLSPGSGRYHHATRAARVGTPVRSRFCNAAPR